MKTNINILLEKYWNAETSLQEEAEIRAYFSGNEVAPEHAPYQDLFTFFSESRMQSTNLDVEKVLASMSDMNLLLEKYWNAETSVEEEAQLKMYFASDKIAPEHLQYKDLFTYYEVNQSMQSDLSVEYVIIEDADILNLLEKYWNAESTLEEEAQLRKYFASDAVADEHLEYKTMFELYGQNSQLTTDLDVAAILQGAASETKHEIGSAMLPKQSKTPVFSLQRWATAIAAVFILGFAAVTLMNQEATPQYKGQATVLDEEAEAREAYEITKEALAFLSKKMNKSSETVRESVSKAENASIFK